MKKSKLICIIIIVLIFGVYINPTYINPTKIYYEGSTRKTFPNHHPGDSLTSIVFEDGKYFYSFFQDEGELREYGSYNRFLNFIIMREEYYYMHYISDIEYGVSSQNNFHVFWKIGNMLVEIGTGSDTLNFKKDENEINTALSQKNKIVKKLNQLGNDKKRIEVSKW